MWTNWTLGACWTLLTYWTDLSRWTARSLQNLALIGSRTFNTRFNWGISFFVITSAKSDIFSSLIKLSSDSEHRFSRREQTEGC